MDASPIHFTTWKNPDANFLVDCYKLKRAKYFVKFPPCLSSTLLLVKFHRFTSSIQMLMECSKVWGIVPVVTNSTGTQQQQQQTKNR